MKAQVRHPYISRHKGICGVQAVMKGTRIPVWAIIGYYKNLGYSAEEIVAQLPSLSLAQVYDALSFYYDHQEEIDRELELKQDESHWKRLIRSDEAPVG